MASDHDQLVAAITSAVPKLLTAMEAFEQMQRNMHPSRLEQLAGMIAPFEQDLAAEMAHFRSLTFPEDLHPLRDVINGAAEYSLRACDGVRQQGEDGFGHVMKAMRAQCRAQEIIYALAPVMSPVSQYFLEVDVRGDRERLELLQKGANREGVGLMAANNERDQRGGFSVYIPENLDRSKPASLVVALHGGTGHGADFLWSWVREARTRGFIVMAPTSQQDTWSLMGEEHDLEPLLSMVDHVKKMWPVDEEHILIGGMSDGATYSLIASLKENSPFTHVAPFSGVLHPQLAMDGSLHFARDKPVYLVHGTLDWMFPVEAAHMAKHELEASGAHVTYREIDGLSHTYARSEHPALLEWFNPALAFA